jgi:hypothetical protein
MIANRAKSATSKALLKKEEFMKKLPIMLLVLIFVCSATVMATGEKVKGKIVLPKALNSVFKTAYPKAKIKAVSKEIEKGVTYYEVESIDGKQKRDILYTVDGKVAEIEEAIDLAALPDLVKETLHKEFAGAKVLKVEAMTKDEWKSYEVKIQLKGKKKEIAIDATGKIIEKPVGAEERRD